MVYCMGIYLYHPSCLLTLLWIIGWRILGRYVVPEGHMLMTATLNKFPQGAWFPFMVAVIMTSFMSFWRWGMAKKRAYELDRRVRLRDLIRRDGEVPTVKGAEGAFMLGDRDCFPHEKSGALEDLASPTFAPERPGSNRSSASINSIEIIQVPTQPSGSSTSELRRRQLFLRATDTPIACLPGVSIFYTTAPTSHSYAPCTFRHFVEHFPALHSTCIFLHIRTAAQPHVDNAEKLALEPSPMWDGVWRGVYRVGYMQTPDFTTAEFVLSIFEKLGKPVEPLTHVLQHTTLKARKPKDTKGVWAWIKEIPARTRGWAIDVVWTGIDEVIGGVGKGWNIPVEDVVSVGAVAKV